VLCASFVFGMQDVVKQLQLNARDPRAFIDQLNEAGAHGGGVLCCCLVSFRACPVAASSQQAEHYRQSMSFLYATRPAVWCVAGRLHAAAVLAC
jgi:hypothetical protein